MAVNFKAVANGGNYFAQGGGPGPTPILATKGAGSGLGIMTVGLESDIQGGGSRIIGSPLIRGAEE